MKTTLVKSLYRNTKDYVGKEIVVAGWVRTVRDSKAFGFIELNDGSFLKSSNCVRRKEPSQF